MRGASARPRRAAALLLALLAPFSAPAAHAAELELIAHRGVHPLPDPARAGGPCPDVHVLPTPQRLIENTLPSLRAAFEHGASLAEVDLRRSADGVLVAFHDETLDCRTDGRGPLAEHTWAELRRLDVGHGYTPDGGRSHPWRGHGVGLMPSLEQLLAALPGRRLLLHPKDPGPEATAALARALAALPAARQARLHFWGDAERFAALRRAAPALAPRRFLAWGSLRGCAARFALLRLFGGFPAACRDGELLLPGRWAARAPGFFRAFGAAARAAGSRLHLSGADSAAGLARAREIGADGIMTDRIEALAPLLAEERLYSGPMPDRELRQRLEELHRELGKTGAVDEGSQELLSRVLVDIVDLLERSEESPHTHHSLAERLGEVTRDFEESHPRLATAVGRLVDTLSNMGI